MCLFSTININFTFEPAGTKIALDSFFLRIFSERKSNISLNFSDCVKKVVLFPTKIIFCPIPEADNRLLEQSHWQSLFYKGGFLQGSTTVFLSITFYVFFIAESETWQRNQKTTLLGWTLIYPTCDNSFLGSLIRQRRSLHGKEIGTKEPVSLLFSLSLKKGSFTIQDGTKLPSKRDSFNLPAHWSFSPLYLSNSKGVVWIQNADKFGVICVRNIFKILKWLIRRLSWGVILIYYKNNIKQF